MLVKENKYLLVEKTKVKAVVGAVAVVMIDDWQEEVDG